jgi:two-component system NtrC family sensor kinase
MMVNSQEVDTTYLARVASIEQFDGLAVEVNDLHLRQELLGPESLERIAGKGARRGTADSTRRRVIETGVPLFERSEDRFRAVIPFNATKVCQKCHAVPIDYTIGAADLRFSLERFSAASAGNWRRSIIIFVIFSFIVVGVAVYVFKGTVGIPVDRLVEATREIQKGNLSHRILLPKGSPAGGDELAFLAERFEEMRMSLADKIDRLDQANRDLSRRNDELEAALVQLRKAQEELVRSERLAATGKMAAQLSHEINNPIHNTRSLLESSLKRLPTDHEARELIFLAVEEVTRMAGLTRQLLDVHRGSPAEMPMAPVDLAALLRDLERSHREMFGERHVVLDLQAAPDLPMIFGSGDKLKQVFINLFLNACDAMPRGGSLRVRAAGAAEAAVVTIADTGSGIDPEHLGRIFDAFFTTKREVSGVGLGLAVTYGIVTQHRGTIDVQSAVGTGTTFTLRFPAMEQDSHDLHSS